MKLTALIVDDEPLARERLRTLLAAEPDVEVIGECVNGREAVAAVKKRRPDLLFLDIQMPELDGFQTLAQLQPPALSLPNGLPAVIFVTAFDEHAVKAFEVHALDYLLKPFKPARLRAAIVRGHAQLAEKKSGGDDTSRRILELLEERTATAKAEYLARVAVRDRDKVHFVKTTAIDWIEASGNYLVLHVGKENHVLRETLTSLEGQLSPKEFFRINRSALVNVDRVRHVEPAFNDEHLVVLADGTKLTLTRGLRDLQERLRFA
jgi:two-component system LytT family response regulator